MAQHRDQIGCLLDLAQLDEFRVAAKLLEEIVKRRLVIRRRQQAIAEDIEVVGQILRGAVHACSVQKWVSACLKSISLIQAFRKRTSWPSHWSLRPCGESVMPVPPSLPPSTPEFAQRG